MALVERQFRTLYATLFSVFVLFGTSMTIIGATLPKILGDFGWSYTTAGAVIAAGAVGYFVAAYLAGLLIAAIGPRTTIMIGLGLEISGLLFFAALPSPLVNLFLYLAIGLGQGCIELTVNWATLRMEKSGSGRAMNLMHGAFAAGAFVGPFIIGLLIAADLSWTLVYRGIAVLFIVVWAILFVLPFKALGGDAGHEHRGSRRALFAHPAYWLGFGALLFYVGVELGVSNWIAEYFVTVFGAGPATGSFMVSLFWAGLLLGRFGVPLVYRGRRSDLVLLSMSLLLMVSVILLSALGYFFGGPAAMAGAAVFSGLAGLGSSIVYPMVVTMLGAIFPRTQSEAVAFAAMGGGIGAFAFPFLMSWIASVFSIRAGFATYAVFSVVVVVLNVVLIRYAGAAKLVDPKA